MVEQFLIFENSNSLAVLQEANFKSLGGEDCNADKCVRRCVNDGYPTEDRAKIGEVSAEKARTISELDVEGRSSPSQSDV